MKTIPVARPRRTLVGLLSLSLLSSLVLAACGSDDVNNGGTNNTTGGFGEREVPTLLVLPESVDFRQIEIGEEDTQQVQLANAGRGNLRIFSIRMVEDDTNNVRDFFEGEGWVANAQLASEQSLTLSVTYKPTTPTPARGYIELKTNDPASPEVRVPLRPPRIAPEIYTESTVTFERVPSGASDWQIREIYNIGQAPLVIDRIALSGSTDFSISFPTSADSRELETDSATLANPPVTLAPNASLPVRVKFAPSDDNPATGEMRIFSNDPVKGEFVVQLRGNPGSPCIKLSHEDGIDFGESSIGQASNRTITVENCSSTADLEVSSIALSNDGGGIFAVREETLPAPLPASPAVLGRRSSANFIVSYTPEGEVVSNGEMVVQSNDPARASLAVPISGKGTINACPVSVAEGRIQGTTRYANTISTQPLKTVELTGSSSSDPDGNIARYEWSLITRPTSSQARLQPSGGVAEPRLWLDLAGTYEVELVVYDNRGLASCESSVIQIFAIPGDEIHIQLVWESPSVGQATSGRGTDLDLHYLHPLGRWDSAPYDVFWRNKIANWGTQATPSEARLDIDDLYGVRPENINHTAPLSGLNYAFGVYYYSDNGFGAAYATMRVYILGTQRLEIRDKHLQGTGTFWYVGIIQWPSGQIVTQDTVRMNFPGQ